MPINDKQQAFINEYCSNGHNGTDAYRKAYPKCNSGHKENASRLLTKDNIRAAIDAKQAKCAAKAEFTVQIAEQNNSRIMELAIKAGQLSAAVSANVANARLYGMDKQTTVTEHTPDPPVGEEAEALAAAAKRYKLKLAGTGS